MKKMIRLAVVILLTAHCSLLTVFGQEKAKPYNETQDVRADLNVAVQKARTENKHVLVQFGGNWCPWCLRFHALVNGDSKIDSLMKADYVYVLANVPREKNKRDYDLFREYDYPNRFGYPVFVILDGNGKKLHIQDSGILEHCQTSGYDTAKVVTFLKMWNVKALDPETYNQK
jgi:thiol:disulfide interchange protein